MTPKQKITLTTLAVLVYLLSFSARLILDEHQVIGTNIINDFTRVFLFGADVAVWLAVAILYWTTKHTDVVRPVGTKLAIMALAAFIVWGGISLLLAPVQTSLGLALIIRLILAALLLATITKIPIQIVFPATAIGLTIAGLVQSLIAISQFALQKSLGFLGESPLVVGQAGVATFTAFGEKLLRAYGTLPHPNILAFFLMLAFLASLALGKTFLDKRFKIASILASFVIVAGLLVSFSRGFIILTLLSALVFTAVTRRPERLQLRLSRALLAGIVVIFLIVVLRPVGQDDSLPMRLVYSEVAQKQSREHLAAGVGPGQSVLLGHQHLQSALAEKNIDYQIWMHQPEHSTYLLVRTEFGWVGLALFFLFLVIATDGVIKKLKTNPSARRHIPFVFAATAAVAILIAMLFEHMFITNPNSLYVAFVIFALLLQAKTQPTTI